MAKFARLRWIPMLVDAYREAQVRMAAADNTKPALSSNMVQRTSSTASASRTVPVMRKRAASKQLAGAKQRTVKQNGIGRPKRQNQPLTPERIMRELRSGHRKSWNRLDSIQQKLQAVGMKVDSLTDELKKVKQGEEGTKTPNPNAHPAMQPLPGPWL